MKRSVLAAVRHSGRHGWPLGPNTAMRSFVLGCLVFVQTAAGQASIVKVSGDVRNALTLTASDLAAMPRTTITAAAHDQTGRYEGVSIRDLLSRAGVLVIPL